MISITTLVNRAQTSCEFFEVGKVRLTAKKFSKDAPSAFFDRTRSWYGDKKMAECYQITGQWGPLAAGEGPIGLWTRQGDSTELLSGSGKWPFSALSFRRHIHSIPDIDGGVLFHPPTPSLVLQKSESILGLDSADT